jgi:hypothetical protein
MQTLNKAIITAHTEQLNWKQQLYRFLRNYRAIPHASTDKTPADKTIIWKKDENKTARSFPNCY